MKNRSSPKLEAALEEVSAQLDKAEERCKQLRIKRNAIAIVLQTIGPGNASSESRDKEPKD